ncbi:IS66-like element accessory protein TnpA [Bradyrhizobium manausense]|uniref:Transposase n=1 Tax=Bradyrhizobium manausense TaxID=989370 RepID=A0A0R3E697_9BRAD|nr:transposase [Bradyrhizobium manausense]
MVDHIVDASEPRGRVDIQVGAGRRRRWSAAVKGRIVAESYAPGTVVSEVARRHDLSPQHLFAWRKAARAGLLSLPAEDAPLFVPVVSELRPAGMCMEAAMRNGITISIEIGDAVVRAAAGVDPAWLRDVLRAVRATT